MAYTLIYQDAYSRKVWDITSLANGIEHYTEIEAQAGKLSFNLLDDPNGKLKKINMGSTILLKSTLKILFRGRVFSAQSDNSGSTKVVAYDNLRYLQGKDTMACVDMKLNDLAKSIASALNLSITVKAQGSFKLEDQLLQSMSYFEMLKQAFNQVFNQKNVVLFMYDNNGKIVIDTPTNNMTANYVGTMSNLTGYNYSEDIDSDTFTKIMLYKQDKEKGTLRALNPQQDLMLATTWGVLQDEYVADENAEDAAVIQYGKQLLANKARVKTSVSLTALNIDGLNAGYGFYFGLPEKNIMQNVYVTKATHKYDNDLPTMNLEVSLVK